MPGRDGMGGGIEEGGVKDLGDGSGGWDGRMRYGWSEGWNGGWDGSSDGKRERIVDDNGSVRFW